MLNIILSIIVLIIGFIFSTFIAPDKKRRDGTVKSYAKIRNLIRGAGALVAVLMVGFSCITTVHTGYTGIVTRFNQVQDYTYEAGLHFKSPFVSVIEMDNREQRVQFTLEAFSSDIQEVSVSGSINYSIDKSTAMRLYKEVGTNYATILIAPRAQEVIKSNLSRYSAEGLIANRTGLSQEIYTALKNDLAPQGINVISVSIENIDFTDAFTNAVEAKQVATQEAQRAKTQQEQQTMEAEQAAARKQIQAQADAEVAKIQADADAYSVQVKAEAEAEANKKISESLTPDLVEYKQIQQWNGELPKFVGGESNIPIINVDD